MTAFPYDLKAMRRSLHRFPEPAFLEYRTASVVAARLVELGFDVRVGPEIMAMEGVQALPSADAVLAAQEAARLAGADENWMVRMPGGQTAVCGEMRRGDGPVLALRFDMDALPVLESESENHLPAAERFSSERTGFMHACGHDGHTAIGLAVAQKLSHPTAAWTGTLRLIFQPAEEGGRGAQPIVSAGLLDDVDTFLALHLGCQLPSGRVALMADGFFWSEKWSVRFSGRAAHAAMMPEEGRNALLAAAAAALGIHALPRDGQADTRVNVGVLSAGRARNVIADEALLELELRAATQDALSRLVDAARRVLQGAALMQGAEVEIACQGKSVSATSDVAVCERLERAARAVGLEDIVPNWPIGGGDDATFMMRRVQEKGGKAGYCLMGADLTAPHHAGNFDFDEDALEHAVRLMTSFAEQA